MGIFGSPVPSQGRAASVVPRPAGEAEAATWRQHAQTPKRQKKRGGGEPSGLQGGSPKKQPKEP